MGISWLSGFLLIIEFKDNKYRVPDGVVTICSMAFGFCRHFVTLIIPSSVRLIGDFVFGPGGGKIVIENS